MKQSNKHKRRSWLYQIRVSFGIALYFLPTAFQVSAQDLNFSQFYELPLLRNPALGGVFIGDVRVQSLYRNQWQSVTVPFRTSGLSAEVNFPMNDYGHYLTTGVQVLHDVAGDSKLTRTHLMPFVTYHVPLGGNEMYLSGSIMGGLVNNRFDPTGLRWDDQYQGGQFDPSNPTRQVITQTGRNYFDLNAGLALSGLLTESISFYTGVGIFHANNPTVAFQNDNVRLGRKWAFNGGVTIETSDWHRITFYGDLFVQNASGTAANTTRVGSQQVALIGAFYTTDLAQYNTDDKVSLSIGGIYRWADAFAPVCRLDLKQWSLGLSYDVNVSQLTKASGARGGFELTLAWKNVFKSRILQQYRLKCVGF
jgi:type IX secretion system PorP/SprF family membrane protein